jgi:hypothetical protein
MTQLQTLKEQKRAAKLQMIATRPLRAYLGNQYLYWESEYNKFKKQIDDFRSLKRYKKSLV